MYAILFALFVCGIESRRIGVGTKNGDLCMTECTHYKDYYFCYLGWGEHNWDYCMDTDTPFEQYYTVQYKSNKPKCTSLCGNFGYNYKWCFTGGGGDWDYCAPSPVNLTTFNRVNDVILSAPGEFTKYGYRKFEHCEKKKRYSGFTEDDARNDVEALAQSYESQHNSTGMTDPNSPITSYVEMQAPPIQNMADVRLTLVIRATIRFTNLATREPIPYSVKKRLRNMNRLANDEQGHLLAACLGGPTEQFNFVPQSPIVNRGEGGESYWRNFENHMLNFLRANQNGRVEWVLVIGYGDLNVNRRPTGFAVLIREYAGNGTMMYDSGNLYFSNDPDGGCPM